MRRNGKDGDLKGIGSEIYFMRKYNRSVKLFRNILTNRNDNRGGVSMRKILVVVDMQNDFVDGALGTPEAVSIVPAVRNRILQYPEEDRYATMDTHGENYEKTQEGANLPVRHCIRGTEGWKLVPQIDSLIPENHRIYKPSFGSEELAQDMKALAETGGEELRIELIGVCTDICVVSNALLLKAALPEVRVTVDPACCAGTTPEAHEAALLTMRSCQVEMALSE